MSKVYISCWFPSDEAIEQFDAKKSAYAFEAASERQARARATMAFIEEHPEIDDSMFQMFIYEDQPGLPRPALAEWDYDFLYEIEWDKKEGRPLVNAEGDNSDNELIDIDKLPVAHRICVLVKYQTTEITKDLIPDALELIQDDVATFDGHLIEAINKTPEIANMYPERILHAINWINAKCSPKAKWPEMKAALVGWKRSCDEERKNAIEKNDNSSSVERPKRSYKHNHKTLDQEIATAFWPGDVDLSNVDKEISSWSEKEIIGREREDWKRFSMTMHTQENILKYDMLTIRDVVQNRPTDIHKSPADLKNYIVEFLNKYGVFENEESEQSSQNSTESLDAATSETSAVEQKQLNDGTAAGKMETTPHVERTGPFYYKEVNGDRWGRVNKYERLLEILSDAGFVEISKEEHQKLKYGVKAESENIPPSSEEVGKQLAAQRGEYVEGISDKDDPKWVDGGRVEHPKEKTEQESKSTKTIQPDYNFTTRADELEKELGDSDNLKLWRNVMRTNPRYTKDLSGTGFEGTSINGEYMIMRATEMFGPIGIGWGFDVIEDKMLPGAPMSEAIYEGNKFVGKKLIRDAAGNMITSLHHSLKISFWYIKEGVKGSITSFGATDYMYMTAKSGIKVDGEAQKKSLTDAIKKSLSLLGFSADVWLGLYDDAAYKAESKLEFEIKDESQKADDSTRIREELDERFKSNVETMRGAVSQNEISKIASSLTRTIGVHLKTARDIADGEYVKYLEGRLRRLEEVKIECMKNLENNA